jgi:hypothetical protein
MFITGQSASSIVVLIDSEQNMAEARSISKSSMVWYSVEHCEFFRILPRSLRSKVRRGKGPGAPCRAIDPRYSVISPHVSV